MDDNALVAWIYANDAYYRYNNTRHFQLHQITRLDLRWSCLQSIPPAIEKLVFLTQLDLSCNLLTHLPDEIGNLTRLQYLMTRHNGLTKLPATLDKLGALTFIDLTNNHLEAFPEPIYQLHRLKMLILSNNHIHIVAPEIGQLTALEVLALQNNLIEMLPAELGLLHCLKSLNVNNNKLTALPRELGALQKLEALYAASNQLEFMPDEIVHIPYFQHLDSGNKTINDFGHLYSFSQLVGIDVHNNLLTTLHPSLQKIAICEDNFLPHRWDQKTWLASPFIPMTTKGDFSIVHKSTLIGYIHAATLAERWPYFQALIQSDMQEVSERTFDVSPLLSRPAAHALFELFMGRTLYFETLGASDWATLANGGLNLPPQLSLLQRIATTTTPIGKTGAIITRTLMNMRRVDSMAPFWVVLSSLILFIIYCMIIILSAYMSIV